MSRTYRKQSGDQWWKSKAKYTQEYTFLKGSGYWIRVTYAKSWDEVEQEMKEATIHNEKKDGYNWDSVSKNVKWHSNKMVRQGNRRELHRVMKDPENYDYNRDHDLRKRGLWWCYD
ncbi:hypothetical protein NU597_003910 [Salmonella enterica]|uniref:Uncharacterized protein n=1 Tax=Salmonella phage Sepoy TaxID=2565517 RepID=A0A4P8NDX6_9CAUD|nr:hypothetical protein HWC16_gp059 [Salmonella phage Sepoy]EJO9576005.1 hypothetical protein [Salmonella enterica]WMM35008.1 hypothetical protein KPBMHCEF_00050 [Salmonella phage EH3]EJP0904589.1 hypothetical protein [Salmonella enterica]EJP1088970.1 hypothetical protein [Salmonella enterica]QCQ65553.1 hypothetical protein Sepoy_059 [Salmonella phage Sepoy]